MLNQEITALEYWRKKYYFQAIIVIGIALAIICLTFVYADFIGLKALITFGAIAISYLMIKELREDLQTRGEALILPHANTLFNNLSFDYGRGIKENTLLNQDVIGAYQVLEYRNILENELFHYEEDLFYSIISSKFLPLQQTAFNGIILTVNMPSATDRKKSQIIISKTGVTINGALSEMLKSEAFTPLLNELRALFHPQKIDIVAENGKIYFWIKTNTPLFHQFSLTSINSVNIFVKRIENLQNTAESIAKVFAVDKQ